MHYPFLMVRKFGHDVKGMTLQVADFADAVDIAELGSSAKILVTA